MKKIFKIVLLFGFLTTSTLFGQNTNLTDEMIEILTDTIALKKQMKFNNIGSRGIIKFELPANTIKWGYYFDAIEKENISDALSKEYFTMSDFVKDTTTLKRSDKKIYIKVVKIGPVRIETLLLDTIGKNAFLTNNNGICSVTRPDGYFKDESTLCETELCYASNKIISNKVLKGEYYIGFRNIDFRKDAFIIIQIIAYIN
jgi:hypothetical protein